MENEIVIFETEDKKISLTVTIEEENGFYLLML